MNRADAIDKLIHDGDTFELEDGRALRVRIEADQDMTVFDDGDWYGSLAWVEPSRETIHARPRLDGFDGAAEKIHTRDGAIWWQPPEDARRDPALRKALRGPLVDLIEYGYCGFIVELLEGEDAYHRPIVRESASLWGVEAFPTDEYRAEIVGELIDEVMA